MINHKIAAALTACLVLTSGACNAKSTIDLSAVEETSSKSENSLPDGMECLPNGKVKSFAEIKSLVKRAKDKPNDFYAHLYLQRVSNYGEQFGTQVIAYINYGSAIDNTVRTNVFWAENSFYDFRRSITYEAVSSPLRESMTKEELRENDLVFKQIIEYADIDLADLRLYQPYEIIVDE